MTDNFTIDSAVAPVPSLAFDLAERLAVIDIRL